MLARIVSFNGVWIPTVLLVLIGIMGVAALRSVAAKKDFVISIEMRHSSDVASMKSANERKISAFRGFIIRGHPDFIERARLARAEFNAILGAMRRTAAPDMLPYINSLVDLEAAHQVKLDGLVSLALRNRPGAFVSRFMRIETEPLREDLDKAFARFQDSQRIRLARAIGESHSWALQTQLILAASTVISLAIAVTVGLALFHSLVALRKSELSFRQLVGSVKDCALFGINNYGQVTSWNWGAERMFGYDAEEVKGMHSSVLWYEKPDLVLTQSNRAITIAREEGRFEETRWFQSKSGQQIWGELVLTAIRDDRGHLQGFSQVVRDITAARLGQEESERIKREAAEQIKVREDFLEIASHDLRQPLTSLKLLLAMMEKKIRSHEELPLDWSKRSHESLNRAFELVGTLLDASSAQKGRLDFQFEELDLRDCLRSVQDTYFDETDEKNVSLSVSAPDPVVGKWDRHRVEQILGNLLSNAIKYGAGKKVEVRVEVSDQIGRVVVRDYGIGIMDESKDHLFSAKSKVTKDSMLSGYGIGLWASKKIAQAMGGDLVIDYDVVDGACFVLELPRDSEAAQIRSQAEQAA